MAYLRNIYDPGVFCDSTVFSDLSNETSLCPSDYDMSHLVSEPNITSTKSIMPKGRKVKSFFPALPTAHNFSALGNPKRFENYIKSELPLVFPSSDTVTASSMPPPGLPIPVADARLRRSNVNTAYLNSLLFRSKVIKGALAREHIRVVFLDAKFAASGLKFDAQAVMKADNKIWKGDAASGGLARKPQSFKDAHIRTWLNNITTNLAIAHNINLASSPKRVADRNFDSSTSTKGPSGGYTLLKPDLVVIDRAGQHDKSQTKEEQVHWRHVYAFVEITSLKRDGLKHVLTQIAQKAACIFDAQPQRTFVCAIGIFKGKDNTLRFTLAVVNCTWFTYTEDSPISGYPTLEFLRAIFAVCFCNTEVIGWDPSMEVDVKTHEVRAITVTGYEHQSTVITTHKFAIVKLIHNSPVLFGRGTRVWTVRDELGIFYILKDSWISNEDQVSEIGIIKHVEEYLQKDPDGYLFQHSFPQYYIGQETVHSTNTVHGFEINAAGTCCQRRIVTASIGDPITSFRSKKEFVSVFLDLVNSMYSDFLVGDKDG